MTKYFILSKDKTHAVDTFENDSICTFTNSCHHYLLPFNNLSYHVSHGLFESNLIEWCKQFCDKTKSILDIGAHTGTFALSLANYCDKVYAFEPQRMTYYALCGSVALSSIENVECLNYGLGSQKQVGKQVLKIVSIDGGGSSLHATKNIIKEEQITIKTLDSLELCDDISFIKMDIEENELQALQGAITTIKLNKNPPILFESNHSNTELFNFIETMGYKIKQIYGYTNMFLASTN